jgi:hypothetical protein
MGDALDGWYAMKDAETNGTSIDYEMKKRGYVRGEYLGHGVYNWIKKEK